MTGDRPLEDRIDRFARGELSPVEARELAQASLDSPELFADLTDSALAKAALYSGTLPKDKIVRFPRKWIIIGVAAAVAAMVFVSPTLVRTRQVGNSVVKPVLALTARDQPVLLANGLEPTPAGVFRGAEGDSRAAQTAGSIVSIEDGFATIDLGSLDGLIKGSVLQVFRDDRSSEVIGRVEVTTVFRERARGRVDGQVRAKDRVRVDDASHLDALLEQVAALYNRGDGNAAYRMAEQASRWVETSSVAAARQAVWWNQLGVLRMLRGDYPHAEEPLSRAAATAYAQAVNNLGVLAELRGDRRAAESRYADAVQALAGPAAEANLARVRGSH
jgi:hypothetical protein